MALKKRYLLTGVCFLNNELVEASEVILWDPDLKNAAMVECDAKGRPIEARQGEEVERVQRLEIQPAEDKKEVVQRSTEERGDLIRLAVQDVLERDDEADWTAKGEIRIETIRELSQVDDVSRAEIEAAAATIEEAEAQKAGTDAAKARAASKTS